MLSPTSLFVCINKLTKMAQRTIDGYCSLQLASELESSLLVLSILCLFLSVTPSPLHIQIPDVEQKALFFTSVSPKSLKQIHQPKEECPE